MFVYLVNSTSVLTQFLIIINLLYQYYFKISITIYVISPHVEI